MRKPVFIGAVLAVAGVFALAAPADASVNSREREQRQRIQQGRRSGELTRLEALRLAEQQARIHREERRYRRDDGRLDAWERADLRRDQNRASRNIYRLKHD